MDERRNFDSRVHNKDALDALLRQARSNRRNLFEITGTIEHADLDPVELRKIIMAIMIKNHPQKQRGKTAEEIEAIQIIYTAANDLKGLLDAGKDNGYKDLRTYISELKRHGMLSAAAAAAAAPAAPRSKASSRIENPLENLTTNLHENMEEFWSEAKLLAQRKYPGDIRDINSTRDPGVLKAFVEVLEAHVNQIYRPNSGAKYSLRDPDLQTSLLAYGGRLYLAVEIFRASKPSQASPPRYPDRGREWINAQKPPARPRDPDRGPEWINAQKPPAIQKMQEIKKDLRANKEAQKEIDPGPKIDFYKKL